MIRAMILLAAVFCVAAPCSASGKKITVDGSWGRNPITYSAAIKRMHFHILLPQGWRAESCIFYPQWILQDKSILGNDPGPRLPSRQAVGVMLKGDYDHLVIEAPYLQTFSSSDNWHGMFWIVGSGYFTKALNDPGLVKGLRIGRRGNTSYAILTSDSKKSNINRFEKSLHSRTARNIGS